MADSSSRFIVGIKFPMDFEMSEVILRGNENKPIQPDQLFLQDIIVNHEDTGRLDVDVTPKGRSSASSQQTRNREGQYLGELVDSQALVESGQGRFNARAHTEGLKVNIKSDSHLPTRVATITARGSSVHRRNPV